MFIKDIIFILWHLYNIFHIYNIYADKIMKSEVGTNLGTDQLKFLI